MFQNRFNPPRSVRTGTGAPTSFVVRFLREHLEVQEPGLQPGHHERGNGQHVAKRILGQEVPRTRDRVVLKLQDIGNVTSQDPNQETWDELKAAKKATS